MKYAIGVDIGGTKIAYGLFDQNKNIIYKKNRKSDATIEALEFFTVVCDDIYSILNEQKIAKEELIGIGIGMPSFIHFETGYIVKTGSLPKIHDFPVREYLIQIFGDAIKIVVDNDAHTGAIAEARHGVGVEFRNIIYCPVSTGISNGIIINGELFRGSYGWAGESGHMLTHPVLEKEVFCGCGNAGCLNSLCSGKMIINHILKWLDEGEESIMPKLAGSRESIEAMHINEAYEMGDQLAIRAVEQMAQYMAMWLYNTYILLNINCFVFSGGLLSMGDKLFGRVQELFHIYNHSDFPVYFYETRLGKDSGIIGAMELLF